MRSELQKSGRHPDYHFFCMHPEAARIHEAADTRTLQLVEERYPERLEYFRQSIAKRKESEAKYGGFISNDEISPETPEWCPVLPKKEVAA